MKNKQQWYQEVVRKLLRQKNIRVHKWFAWRQESDIAYAWLTDDDKPMVILPYPKTLATFYVCLHEIGHVCRPSSFYGKHEYVNEYLAETWALKYCKEKLNINPTREEHFAKYYVLSKLLPQWRRSVDPSNVRKDILKWLNVKPNELDVAILSRKAFLRHYKAYGTLKISIK